MSTLISSRKIAAYWVDMAPGTGTPFDDCHDKTVQSPGWYEDPPGVCHYYTVEETQRRCFSGRFTFQKQVELWEDTYEVDDGEIVAGRAGAYSSAGGAVVLGSIAAYTFFVSNPVGWVVGAGLAIGTILTGGGTILWIESDRFVTRKTEFRIVDTQLTRIGFSGTYSVEITNVRILGNPSADVPCDDPQVQTVRNWMTSTLPTTLLERVGETGTQDNFVSEENFARGS